MQLPTLKVMMVLYSMIVAPMRFVVGFWCIFYGYFFGRFGCGEPDAKCESKGVKFNVINPNCSCARSEYMYYMHILNIPNEQFDGIWSGQTTMTVNRKPNGCQETKNVENSATQRSNTTIFWLFNGQAAGTKNTP